MKRRVQMLMLDTTFFQRLGMDITKVISPTMAGVHLNNLIKIIEGLTNEGYLPPDSRMEWLYFDPRFNNWAVLIASESYRQLAFDEMAPLVEI